MSSEEAIWSNARTLSVQNAADTTVPIAGIQEVSIVPAYEHEELYTMDSSFRDTVKRYEHNVNVEITYAKFSVDAAQEWLGGEGATATASQDDSDPALFSIEDVTPSADGTFERTAVVENVVFPEFPVVEGSYGEYEEWDLSGSGRQLSDFSDTSGV